MKRTEKIILGFGLLFSLGIGLLLRYIFHSDFTASGALWLASLGILLWLLPFALAALFIDKAGFLIGVFIVGTLAFFIPVSNWYVLLGMFLLWCVFINWVLQIRYAKNSAIRFSVWHVSRGFGFFLLILAAFGALLSFYSPYAKEIIKEPKIPEKFLDSIYDPLSEVILGQLNQQLTNSPVTPDVLNNPETIKSLLSDPKFSNMPGAKEVAEKLPTYNIGGPVTDALKERATQVVPTPGELKPDFYKNINASVSDLTQRYQYFIPFAFATGTFFILQLIFVPLKYLAILLIFITVKILVKLKWFNKEKVSVEVERINI